MLLDAGHQCQLPQNYHNLEYLLLHYVVPHLFLLPIGGDSLRRLPDQFPTIIFTLRGTTPTMHKFHMDIDYTTTISITADDFTLLSDGSELLLNWDLLLRNPMLI